ncbi:hypothetical protein STAS_05637 [Striga asiatica]|uniref:Uncharacterized protein n=1 Tax=Striga asiatica TaxID=4170 RepID=A0A5A7PBG0_STRAF|nr:hypothetical protein STAS_05637 [Striga asiatica]
MKEFPSCFGESGVQIANNPLYASSSSSTKPSPHENLVTCIYNYTSQRFSGFITITWIKHVMAYGLSICIIDSSSSNEPPLCKIDIKPWLFSKKKGARNLTVNSTRVNIHWDLSSAKFGSSSPEPLEGYYLKIALNQELCVLLGDSSLNEACRKTEIPLPIPKANFVAKREHVFGKRLYTTSKAQICENGKMHDIRVEYDPSEDLGKCLVIYIDRKAVLKVSQLVWKFRGNRSIFVDGISVEVYWDVFNWLFGRGADCNAVFLFRSNNVSREKGRSKDGMDSQKGFVCVRKNSSLQVKNPNLHLILRWQHPPFPPRLSRPISPPWASGTWRPLPPPLSCAVETMATLSLPDRPPPVAAFITTRLMLKDAMARLRVGGYSVGALSMRVRYLELSDLRSMTLFAVDNESIFTDDGAGGGGGRGYLAELGFHILPNKLLTAADLIELPAGTALPTMERGRSLVVTSASDGGPLAPTRINYVKVRSFDLVCNERIVVHGLSKPFRHVELMHSGLSKFKTSFKFTILNAVAYY